MQMGFFLMWRGRVYNDCMIFLFPPIDMSIQKKEELWNFWSAAGVHALFERSWRWGVRRLVTSMIQQRPTMELSSVQMMGTIVDFFDSPDDFGPVVVQQIRPIMTGYSMSFSLLVSFLHHHTHTQTFVSAQITHFFPYTLTIILMTRYGGMQNRVVIKIKAWFRVGWIFICWSISGTTW